MTSGGHVLIVDDSALVLKLLRRKLGAAGFQVATTALGAEALALATDETSSFDLFILDILMEGIDGCELARKLRAHPRTQNTPILMLTSLGPESLSMGLKAGADDFLSKSAHDEELLARVRSLVQLGRLRARSTQDAGAIWKMLVAGPTVAGEVPSDSPASTEPRCLVLLVDVASLRERLAARLGGPALTVISCESAEAALEVMSRRAVDVLISSYALALEAPGAVLPLLQMRQWPPAVFVLDAQVSSERRLAAFDQGADAYVPEDVTAEELGTQVANTLRRRMRYQALEVARDRAVRAAISDPLTGLYNRGYFEEALRMELLRSHRSGQGVALLLVDLDHFKRVNDKHGHPAGDEVLRATARILRQKSRVVDIAARYGGEEFALILPESLVDGGVVVGERIRATLANEPMSICEGRQLTITASFGVADSIGCESPRDLVVRADVALYEAKKRGRNRVVASRCDSVSPDASSESIALPHGDTRELLEYARASPDGPLARIQSAAERLSREAPSASPHQVHEIQEAARILERLLHEAEYASRC